MTPRRVYRILDANFNRSREGLRVCEEVARFALDAPGLTRELKRCRHQITDIWKRLFEKDTELVRSRDVGTDVGRTPPEKRSTRRDFWELYWANSQRSKESLRALEESVKLLDVRYAGEFKKVRFKVYALEKRALPKLEAVRHHDAGTDASSKRAGSRSGRRGRGPTAR